LFARSPIGLLEQSALGGGAPFAFPFSIRSDRRAAVSVAVFSRFAIYANVVSPTTYNALMTEDITVLLRPVGPRELALLEASSWKRWPARLPEQPIFYPVANFEYASEIASKWNVQHSGSGHVTRFEVRTIFMRRYELHQVGASHHVEWWIPAEDLDELNENIVGTIEVIASLGNTASL